MATQTDTIPSVAETNLEPVAGTGSTALLPDSQGPAKPQTRLAAVDGLRGLAATMVLLHHIHLVAGAPTLVLGLGLTFGYLKTGVNLFFVLSGFCLFYPYTRAGSRFVAGTFFRRRVRRILPPYYAAIALVVLLPVLIKPAARLLGLVTSTPRLPSSQQIWTHLLMLHTFNADTFLGLDGPFWSLGVETQFYLAFPIAVWLVGRFGARGVGIIALITVVYRLEVSAIGHAHASPATLGGNNPTLVILVNFFLGHWLEFALGMLVALVVRRRARRPIPAGTEIPLLAAALGMYIFAQTYITLGPSDRWLPPVADSLLGIAFSSVLFAACCQGLLSSRLLGLRLPVWIGTISYSLYLIHLPILQSIAPSLRTRHLSGAATMGLVALVGVPLVLTCTMLFFRLFERPFLSSTAPAPEPATALSKSDARGTASAANTAE